MFPRLAALFCLILLASINVAQEATPPITAENATQLVPIQTVGSPLPGKLAFSPDGRYILASTSEQTYVYESEQPDAAPKILPFTDFNFDAEGRLVADGKYWNLDSGLSVGIPPMIRVLRPKDNQPNTLIEVVKPGGETIKVDTGFPDDVIGTAVSDDYSILAVLTRVIERDSAQVSLYLYHLASGELYAILPQNAYSSLKCLCFIPGSTTLILEFYAAQVPIGYINVYEAKTGKLLFDYSGGTQTVGKLSPDGQLFAYVLDDNRLMVLGHELVFQTSYDSASPYAVGNQHLAIIEENAIKVIDLRDTLAKPFRMGLEENMSISDFYFAEDDRRLVSDFTPVRYVWDLQNPTVAPVAIEQDEGGVRDFNRDFTRYTVNVSFDTGYKYVVYDLATRQMLAELPSNVILNDLMSQAVYWQDDTVMLRDIENGETLPLLTIENYLGRVLAFSEVAGIAAFADDQLTLIQVADATVLPVEVSPAPYSVDFTADGETVLVNRGFQGEDGTPAYVAILETRSGEEIRELNGESIYTLRLISPAGHYLVDDYSSVYGCSGPYSFPALILFSSLPGEDRSLIYVDGACDQSMMAFTRDDSTFYAVAYSRLFAFQFEEISLPAATGSGDYGVEFSILNYTSPPDDPGLVEYVEGMALSPDQRRIALMINRSSVNNNLSERRVEVFDLAQLEVGTQRVDIQPLATMPDASTATFSPDGNSIVTNTGLFAVGYETGAEIVDGTISAFTSDSQLLATYQDGVVHLWDVNNPSHITFPLAQYAIDGVQELTFSPDNRYLYIVRRGDVQMWGVK